MLLLELPLEILRMVIATTVKELGLKSMKARFTCRILADEILDAVIVTRAIEDVSISITKMSRIDHHHDVIARYLYHRVCTDGAATHTWITTVRETCRILAQYTKSENKPDTVELFERSACFCLAVNAGASVFRVFKGEDKNDKIQLEGGTLVNCLALAAWIGDMTLVRSLNIGEDPLSFFGRPSWAAAAQGHADIVQFFLDKGALPYEPTYREGSNFNLSITPLGVAAYMGHEDITQLYLQSPYYCSGTQLEEGTAIYYAAQGNQPTALTHLLEHYKGISTHQEFLSAIDGALVFSCRRGASLSARILLDYGADADESDTLPRSCLQLAAIANSAQIVEMLLDAGASLEATSFVHRRTSSLVRERRLNSTALMSARRRDNAAIIKLIEDKQRQLNGGDS